MDVCRVSSMGGAPLDVDVLHLPVGENRTSLIFPFGGDELAELMRYLPFVPNVIVLLGVGGEFNANIAI